MHCFNKKSFTLAEIMIALTIIGIITAILLPVAIQTTPNEKVMKFKKANATLARVINELVTSGEYYTPGDLGKKADGSWVEETNYLCNTIASTINYKTLNCKKLEKTMPDLNNTGLLSTNIENPTDEYWSGFYKYMDDFCKTIKENENDNYVKTIDGIYYIDGNTNYPFGLNVYSTLGCSGKSVNNFYDVWDGSGFATAEQPCLHYVSGFYFVYRKFCIDIDEIGKGEDPFGYGIRVDGKILLGARAQAWLEKDIQDKE